MTERPGTPAWAWFGGHLVPFAEARVPLEDRALQFGEGLYEVIAVVAGEPFRLANHVERMRGAARELGLHSGVPELEQWKSIVARLHRREPHPTAILYAQVTGGAAPRSHVPPEPPQPFFFAYLRSFAFPVPVDISRGIAAITFPDSRWQRRDLKTVMLLPAVLARKEALAQGAEEAIFVGQDGFANEGSASTLFAVLNKTVITPPSSYRILPGVSTVVVEEICAQLGLAFSTRPLTLSDVRCAEELFVASTALLLMPVVRLDAKPVGDGVPGSITLQLAYHFQRRFWGQHGPPS